MERSVPSRPEAERLTVADVGPATTTQDDLFRVVQVTAESPQEARLIALQVFDAEKGLAISAGPREAGATLGSGFKAFVKEMAGKVTFDPATGAQVERVPYRKARRRATPEEVAELQAFGDRIERDVLTSLGIDPDISTEDLLRLPLPE